MFCLQEAERILDGNKPDEDAQTRGQAKQIEELKNASTESEEPPAKKAKLVKDSTMAATAKVMILNLNIMVCILLI